MFGDVGTTVGDDASFGGESRSRAAYNVANGPVYRDWTPHVI